MLHPGGRLIYCTCSLYPEEGESQIEAALTRQSGLHVDRQSLLVPGMQGEWVSEIGLRLRPDYWADQGGMDGFFVTALHKATG